MKSKGCTFTIQLKSKSYLTLDSKGWCTEGAPTKFTQERYDEEYLYIKVAEGTWKDEYLGVSSMMNYGSVGAYGYYKSEVWNFDSDGKLYCKDWGPGKPLTYKEKFYYCSSDGTPIKVKKIWSF